MEKLVTIIGGGLAGSAAALQLAERGIRVRLVEMRPGTGTAVHKTSGFAELVCSNSLKSTKPSSAAGMQKRELEALGSKLYAAALKTQVAAGGALAVNRDDFSAEVTRLIEENPLVSVERREAKSIAEEAATCDVLVLASGPLTSEALAADLQSLTGADHLAFYDAAAPIVMADSLDMDRVFRQSRYEEGLGDYLNAPFERDEYDAFIEALLGAERVIAKEFETRELFQACQPIEEIARSGHDAPRFGPLKPVGLTNPATGRRPWAALQLRAEDAYGSCYNLVGFQTNLTFPEQRRVFRMIPGLENAEFVRYGVMHRNTFIDAPHLLDRNLQLHAPEVDTLGVPVFVAGQLGGTEGYVEAIRSGLHVALSAAALLTGVEAPEVPADMAFGALLAYATNPATEGYQPSHVNFGMMPPLETHVKNKGKRYEAYAARGERALAEYCAALRAAGLLPDVVGFVVQPDAAQPVVQPDAAQPVDQPDVVQPEGE